MNQEKNSLRRWQFSLYKLFAITTVVALFSAAIAGAFGVPIRSVFVNLGSVLLVVVAGVAAYLLLLLVLGSPLLLIFGSLKLASRILSRRKTVGTQDDPSPTCQESSDKGAG